MHYLQIDGKINFKIKNVLLLFVFRKRLSLDQQVADTSNNTKSMTDMCPSVSDIPAKDVSTTSCMKKASVPDNDPKKKRVSFDFDADLPLPLTRTVSYDQDLPVKKMSFDRELPLKKTVSFDSVLPSIKTDSSSDSDLPTNKTDSSGKGYFF